MIRRASVMLFEMALTSEVQNHTWNHDSEAHPCLCNLMVCLVAFRFAQVCSGVDNHTIAF